MVVRSMSSPRPAATPTPASSAPRVVSATRSEVKVKAATVAMAPWAKFTTRDVRKMSTSPTATRA